MRLMRRSYHNGCTRWLPNKSCEKPIISGTTSGNAVSHLRAQACSVNRKLDDNLGFIDNGRAVQFC